MGEVAAGFIIFRWINNSIYYLLLQTSYGEHHWTPPKGHLNNGESLHEAAVRETAEECGYTPDDYEEVPGFQRTLEYPVKGHTKKVVYFLAMLTNEAKRVSLSKEHQQFQWLELIECSLITYPSMQKVLEEADGFYRSLMKKERNKGDPSFEQQLPAPPE